ncbi:hypothetical protein H0H92_013823, partial [Tricholoma furcatifolium]
NTQPVQKAIPRVTVRFQGELKTVAPEPIQHARRLILKLNGRVLSVVPLQSHPILSDTISEAVTDRNDADVDAENTSSDLRHQVDEFLDKNSTDQEDGPDWMFDEGEVVAKDPMYVFCPAVHRKQALRLFTKHFCQHPIFLERDGKWDAQKIRNQAVYEMYQYCTHRNLPELWGYMWTSWYSPKMWILWARSTSPYLTRLRTTMNVENFWRQLKHDYLHNVTRPRLDQLVWILINRVTPSYLSR